MKLAKYATRLYLIALSILFLINYTAIFDEKIDLNGDNIIYYSLGKALSEGKGFTNTIGYTETPHSHFPPGYPAFIAVMMKLGFTTVHAIKVINGVLLFLSMLMLFFVLRIMSGSRLIAFTATAFTISQYTILQFATMMMSEMIFVFFTLIIILIILMWPPDKAFTDVKKRWKDIGILLTLLFSLGYIYFIRTMGLSIIVAVLLYFGIKIIRLPKNKIPEKNPVIFRYFALTFCLVIAFLVPKTAWDIRNNSIGKAKSDYVGDFYKKLDGQVMSGFADWKERVINNTSTYMTEWIPSAVFSYAADSQREPVTTDWIQGIFIFLLMLLALYMLLRGGLLLLLYLGVTMGVLLVWPEQYGGHRYMLPVIPFLIFLVIYGSVHLLRYVVKRWKPAMVSQYQKVIIITVCVVFTFIAYPSYSASVNQLKIKASYKEYTAEIAGSAFAEYIQAIRWVKNNIKDGGRIATRKPEVFYMYSGGLKSGGFPYYATPEEIVEHFTKGNVRYVIIDRWFRHAYTTIIPAVQKYPQQFRVIYQVGGNSQEPPTYVLTFNPVDI